MFKGPRTLTGSFTVGMAMTIAALVAPSAGALSSRAAVPAASSGVTASAVAAGSLMSCAILKGDQLKCWGRNDAGQLGQGDTVDRGKTPGQLGDFLSAIDLGTGRKVRSVAIGNASICAVLDNGRAKCWGDNLNGQLGYGDVAHRGNEPGEMGNNLPYVQVGSKRKVKTLAAGYNHTCALLDNGSVKCWGRNDAGQLGIDDKSGAKIQIGDSAGEMGDALLPVALGRKAKSIGAGESFSCALLDNGTVKCWGANDFGQLGQGDTANRGDTAGEMAALLPVYLGRKATAIGVGYTHACALLDNGTVKCWGANGDGQLGQGDTTNRGDAAGELSALQPIDFGVGRKARKLTVGGNGYHSCALLDNGAYKCWGYNDGSGTLGLGDLVNHGDNANEMGDNLPLVDVGGGRTIKAIVGGSDHTCSLLDNGTIKCWGWNRQGQLGLGDTDQRGDNEPISSVPAVNLGVRVRSLSVYSYHACSVLENRSVQCWGDNSYGELGYGDTEHRGDAAGEMGDSLPALDLGTGRSVKSLGTGPADLFTCAVLDNGQVKCWGAGNVGRTGSGTSENLGDGPGEMGDNLIAVDLGAGRTAKSVALGGQHACAILDSGQVKCWGRNDSGQLGVGDTVNRGDSNEPGHLLGDYLPTVQLGSGRRTKSLAAGFAHTCALLDNGAVKCWGDGRFGQLGNGRKDDIGDGDAEMGNNLAPIELGRKAVAISAGSYHTCALLNNSTVKCWGSNTNGQLGLGDNYDHGDEPDEMGSALDTVDLGTGARVRAIAAGYFQTCALLVGGNVKCWGSNGEGNLGYGDTADRGGGPDQMGDYLPAVSLGGSRRAIAISVGDAACALLDDYSVRCWGYNDEGQLGRGDSFRRGDNPGEMGNNLRPVAFTG